MALHVAFNAGRPSPRAERSWEWLVPVAAKIAALGALLAIVNPGVAARVELLVDQGRFGTLTIFAGVWAVALAATFVAAFEGRGAARLLWAIILSMSAVSAWVHHTLSRTEFTIFDAVSLWTARHEAERALSSFGDILPQAMILFAGLVLAFALPVRRMLPRQGFHWRFSPLVPVIPITLIAAVVYLKAGNGSQAMPKHFAQASFGLLLAYKALYHPVPERGAPAWTSDRSLSVSKILVLVDESIRADYLDPKRGEGETPEFATIARDFVDFGPAASGGVCSSYSNAILRFAASRDDIGSGINANPTLFAYARQAGYRTVYIDAQAHTLSNSDRLQNFMTRSELGDIDAFYPLVSSKPATADRDLAEIVRHELDKHDRVFIFANKNGAHFPYDETYPASQARYHPTITEQGYKSAESNVASYRNALHWNVDGYFKSQFTGLDLSDVALVYTSDHGQFLQPGSQPHCVSDGATPQMALVPLYAYSADAREMQRLRDGAGALRGRASHFQIAPTLLTWMGYPEDRVLQHYGESLAAGTKFAPAFTMGDIFGLFSVEARWQGIDLARRYRNADGSEAETTGAAQSPVLTQ